MFHRCYACHAGPARPAAIRVARERPHAGEPAADTGVLWLEKHRVAHLCRRLVALGADWVLGELIVAAVTRHSIFSGTQDAHYFTTMYWTLLVFGLEAWLLTAISGITVGKRLLGIRVIRTGGGRPGFGWALLRTVLLFFVVPPLLSDRDLRGLHDRAADTIVVRM